MNKILLVNPPIHDFSAYDFWLKPYGLLSVGGFLRNLADLRLFDYLDRGHPQAPKKKKKTKPDPWGRGRFHAEQIDKPAVFTDVPRRFHRHGLPRELFQKILRTEGPFDLALIQTGMTYWYPGVIEVLDDIKQLSPGTRTILGGVYATLCPDHARGLGADLVVVGDDLEPLWKFLGATPDTTQPPFWEGYPALRTGVVKLTAGCPFRCTHCAVPKIYPEFKLKSLEQAIEEIAFLKTRGAEDVAFYDDALLHQTERLLMPLLEEISNSGHEVRFHTPNGVNVRFITERLAGSLVRSGFTTFYLGFESQAPDWHAASGAKLLLEELEEAVANLVHAGALRSNITAYLMLGHPRGSEQELESSMEAAHSLGIRVMLSEFSPIPGTPDGELCERLVDPGEPLSHNKTAFAYRAVGEEEVNRLKNHCKELNKKLD